jgi:hypothetical protein
MQNKERVKSSIMLKSQIGSSFGKNLDAEMDISSAWETTEEDIKNSAKKSAY